MGLRSRTQVLLHRWARRTVTAAVAVSPWLFGSAEGWAWLALGVVVLAGAALWFLSLAVGPPPSGRVQGLALVMGAGLLLVIGQTVPLPAAAAARLSPASASLVQTGRETLAEIGRSAPGAENAAALSVSPLATGRSAVLFALYAAVFFVLVHCVHTWHEVRSTAAVLVTCGFVMALVAVAHKLSGSREILWIHAPRYAGDAFGPFSNRNHFASHALMLFSLAVGLCLGCGRSSESADPDARECLAWFSTRRASRLALLAFMAALLGASVWASLSRGGIASLVVGAAAALAVGAATRRRRGGTLRVLGVVVLATVAVAVWFGWDAVLERFRTAAVLLRSPGRLDRLLASQDTLLILGAFPIFGCGFGCFRHVFPLFAGPELHYGRWLHAHNDWAQLLAEGGVAAGLLASLAVFLFVREFVRKYGGARGGPQRFALGCVVGLAGMGVHSFVDYGLHKPANAFLFSALCGLCLAALQLSRPRDPDEEGAAAASDEEIATSGRGSETAVRAAGCVGLALLVIVAGRMLPCLRGELAFKRFEYAERLAGRVDDPRHLERIVAAAVDETEVTSPARCGSPEAVAEEAATLFAWSLDKSLSPAARVRIAHAADRLAVQAVRAAPTDPLYWLRLGRAEALHGRWEAADACLRRARELDPHAPLTPLFPAVR